jgi:hypothetical protein
MQKNVTVTKSQADSKRNKMIRIILGVVVGGALGFGYYRLVGCASGTCPITSNPWIAMVYGAVMGALFTSI